MIYLSAQPDQIYFIWQLEIQLRNFNALQINKEQIHILVAYKPDKRLNPRFHQFIEENGDLATFYTYPDLREKPKYTSSVRPNILKQHFEKYPELVNETIFYHDSDILFSRIPQIEDVKSNNICYVSDTRNYLDMSYIRRVSSENLLDAMLVTVGLSKEKLTQEDSQTGGAQYILKDMTADFWEKVELDSEALYELMKDYNTKKWEQEYPEKKEYKSKKRGIQIWCADMWAVLWNLWLYDKKVEIHPEMNFSWPYSPVEEWNTKAIQHYSGNIEDKQKCFKKVEYLNYFPWYDNNLLKIPDTICSYKIVELIRNRKTEFDALRPIFRDSCVLIDGQKIEILDFPNFQLVKSYIQKYIDVDVYLWADVTTEIDDCAMYSHILCLPYGIVFDWEFLLQVLSNMSQNTCYYSSELYKVDLLLSETFAKVLDIDLLDKNKGKFNTQEAVTRPLIRCVALSGSQNQAVLQKLLTSPAVDHDIPTVGIPVMYVLA